MTSSSQSESPASREIPRLTERLFREEAGKMVSILTGILGVDRLELAEDVVQESLVRALRTWPYYGVPENPAAWLLQTAKHRAVDLLRREKRFREKQDEIGASFDRWSGDIAPGEAPRFEDEIQDDRLRLMFACCHPLVPADAATALALKTLCGFSPAEIAKAFLTSEPAVLKRLTRARQKIQELGIPFEIPSGEALSERLDGVLQVLYLLFNEGYKASSGDRLVRDELCTEATRLAVALAAHPVAGGPRTHALAALMLLHGARLPGRSDGQGRMLRLEEQDRTRWDRAKIAQGMLHLARSTAGTDVSPYHLQAGIAACHATAADDASTDWKSILAHYDLWVGIDASPVVALNRAIALAKVEGPEEGIRAVESMPNREQLESYYLVHAVLGDFEMRRGRFQSAASHYRRALELAEVGSERSFLTGRLKESEEGSSMSSGPLPEF